MRWFGRGDSVRAPIQGFVKFGGGLEAIGGRLRQDFHDNDVHHLGHTCVTKARGFRGLADMRHHEFELAAGFERRTSGEHLVEHDPQGVIVAASVQMALAFNLFRRKVARVSGDAAAFRSMGRIERAHLGELRKFAESGRAEENAFRGQAAMQSGLLVQAVEGIEQLACDGEGFLPG